MMKLATYNKYKDSEIEWLGDVPEHWEVKRTKDIFRMERGKFTHRPRNDERLYNGGSYPFIQTGDISKSNTFVKTYKQKLNDEGIKYSKLFKKGTVVMTIAATIGEVAILDFDCYFPDSIVAFHTKHNSKYFFYLLLVTKSELDTVKTSNAQDNINLERLSSLFKVVPPILEQTKIANYLDQATTKIDEKIDLLSQKIKHYQDLRTALINRAITKGLDDNVEMKDSEIKWLGDVPYHWKAIRFKQVFKKKSKRTNPRLNCGSISFGEVVFKDNDSIPSERRETYQEVLKGEFLINPLNLNFDLKSLRTALSTKDVIVSPGYIVLQSNKFYDKNYLRWLLHEFDVSTMKNLGAGIRQTLRFDDVGSSVFCTPPINEQKKIGDYLNQKTSTIDKIISTIITQIEHQKELRKTLINDVVTGKVKVENN